MKSTKKSEKYNALKEGLTIDRANLDEELVRHPPYLLEVGEQVAFAASRRDGLRDTLKSVKADASARIREELTSARDKKPTEAEIALAVEASSDVLDAADELNAASGEAQLWDMLYEAVRTRGSMLRDLTQLTIAGVSASASVHGVTEARQALTEARNKAKR